MNHQKVKLSMEKLALKDRSGQKGQKGIAEVPRSQSDGPVISRNSTLQVDG
jgi:hypothetical protein